MTLEVIPNVHININYIKSLCKTAGEAIIGVYNSPDFKEKIEIKNDNSPLTEADKKANEIITSGLKSNYPNIPIISEEDKQTPYETRKAWKTFWLVDPLDGTKEFIKRNGEFTVNIALIEDNMPIAGFIYVPVTKDLYFSFDKKSYKQDKDGTEREIKVSKKEQNLTAIGSRSHTNPTDEDYLSQFDINQYISAGSSLKFCKIAEGSADLYYRSGPTMEWDTAAGHSIVLGAGGNVENITYNKPDLKNGAFLCKGY